MQRLKLNHCQDLKVGSGEAFWDWHQISYHQTTLDLAAELLPLGEGRVGTLEGKQYRGLWPIWVVIGANRMLD
jgi:hypothetical protein